MKWYGNDKMMKTINKNDLSRPAPASTSTEEEKSSEEKLEEMQTQDNVQVNEEVEVETPQEVSMPSITADEIMEPSVIESKTTVNGNVECEGDLTVKGEINGEIYVTGKVVSSGKTIGKMTAASVMLLQARHQGDINSSEAVSLEYENSTVIGNITADSCVIKGKIKGNVLVTGKCFIGSNAIVLGDIQANIIEIEEGALVKGHLEITKDAIIE